MEAESKILNHLLRVEEILRERVQNPLIEPEAFIEWAGIRMLTPGSLLSIQGKSGSHKSRLVEEFAITLLTPKTDKPNALGMIRIDEEPILVVGMDTERDTKYQFPKAIKKIIDQSGNSDINKLFRFTSLIHLNRNDRRIAAREFLQSIRNYYTGKMCLFIDVVTDISKDFNSVSDMGDVIDQLKEWLNEFNCSIIASTHENPGSEKMRGHLGTELLNKATDSISVKLADDDSIKIKFVKCRNYRRPNSIDAAVNETTGRLELITQFIPQSGYEQFLSKLIYLFTVRSKYTRQSILDEMKSLNKSNDSIDNYLKDTTTISIDGTPYNIVRSKEGKETTFEIVPPDNQAVVVINNLQIS